MIQGYSCKFQTIPDTQYLTQAVNITHNTIQTKPTQSPPTSQQWRGWGWGGGPRRGPALLEHCEETGEGTPGGCWWSLAPSTQYETRSPRPLNTDWHKPLSTQATERLSLREQGGSGRINRGSVLVWQTHKSITHCTCPYSIVRALVFFLQSVLHTIP